MKIDTRAGSKELIAPLAALGVPVEPGVLLAGDVEIVGNGPGGPLLVGVEYKSIEDTAACMRSGRFADQARGMKANFNVSWLLVEGRVRAVKGGMEVQTHKGKWRLLHAGVTYQELTAWLLTMSQVNGILLYRTEDLAESVEWLRIFNNWWTSKDWHQHRAHLEWYTPPVVGNPFLGEPPLVQKAAALLPHIGGIKAERVGKEFRSLKKMCCVSQEDWTKIPGVGKKMAKRIVEAIEEEAHD